MHGDAHGDAGEPGGEERVAAEVGQRPERLDEGGLNEVFDVGPRSRQPADHPVDQADVAVEELAERRRIAPSRAVDQDGDVGGG